MGWFFPSVAPDVGRQRSVIDERLPTELADVWSLPAVDPPVAPQGPGPGEGFTADAAGVRFDAGVTPHVGLNVLIGSTTDVTDLTHVSVDLQVVHQGF